MPEIQRSRAKHRDRLCLDLLQVVRRRRCVRNGVRFNVNQQNVRKLTSIQSVRAFSPFFICLPCSFQLLKLARGPGAMPRAAHCTMAQIRFPRE
jgi:hypothetical protein